MRGFSMESLREVRATRFLLSAVDEWLIEEILPYIGERVLEVGCGWGNLTRHLGPNSELWVAIDNDHESVDRLLDLDLASSVEVLCQDVCDSSVLRLVDRRFDTVVSLNVLEHIRDDARALEHMRRLLVPGGALF